MIGHILCRPPVSHRFAEIRCAETPEGVIADALRKFGFRVPMCDDAQHVAPGERYIFHLPITVPEHLPGPVPLLGLLPECGNDLETM